MKNAQPQAIYLRDYQKPPFLIDRTELTIDLRDDGATVTSRLQVRRNPEAPLVRNLVLAGTDLEFVRADLNGSPLPATRLLRCEDALEITDVPEAFSLDVVTQIRPHKNTCLEGLYHSGRMFCTQCEAEGFRRITYYLDRPDVLSRFVTRIEADRASCPVLLSNGNLIDAGELPDGRHFAVWDDPFPKPSYLFALVAGDLQVVEDQFTTCSGRQVALKMYVEAGDEPKCEHALASLKRSMRWDEEVYGREYDLDIFMIVAVSDFNMGAMENKGLNIFNASAVLASQDTASDATYQRIEAIVAHEYFHNWSGNRVTCRDWFQLSLKEGFTVFRDAEYSADQGSRTVNRIEDVTLLRTSQFAEDAGPMAHPVRPESFIEISNFYTLTVYEKGAEVVRMLHTLLGAKTFRQGTDLYFSRHDGQAVTTDDFVRAMEEVSGRELSQFKRWYSQAGTPVLDVSDAYDAASATYTLTFRQSCPPSPGMAEKQPFHIPVRLGLLDEGGADMPVRCSPADTVGQTEGVLELTQPTETLSFYACHRRPVPSLLRGFSAPIKLNFPYTREQLAFLMAHDSDGFNRWDAGQRLATTVILEQSQALAAGRELDLDVDLLAAYRRLLADDSVEPALLAKMLALPSENYLIEITPQAHIQHLCQARSRVRRQLLDALQAEVLALYHRHSPVSAGFSLSPEAMAQRAARSQLLSWLAVVGVLEAAALARRQYDEATNMTDRSGAMRALAESPFVAEREAVFGDFYARWKGDHQMVEQWFAMQSGSAHMGQLAAVRALLAHPAFEIRNPNKVRSVIGNFANNNPANFHAADGSAYAFLADQILRVDALNPQIAARLATPLTRWARLHPDFAVPMRRELQRVAANGSLSRDLYEVVSKSLAPAN